jgi:hypothetical protein
MSLFAESSHIGLPILVWEECSAILCCTIFGVNLQAEAVEDKLVRVPMNCNGLGRPSIPLPMPCQPDGLLPRLNPRGHVAGWS